MKANDQLMRNLLRIRRGVKTRAPGIRKCPRCHEPYIVDRVPREVRVCPDCRPKVTFLCRQCAVKFPGNREGNTLCPCCRIQPPLFDLDPPPTRTV